MSSRLGKDYFITRVHCNFKGPGIVWDLGSKELFVLIIVKVVFPTIVYISWPDLGLKHYLPEHI